ncbi:MAG: hypothetical protein RR547_04480 [Raoultibacter sp.]
MAASSHFSYEYEVEDFYCYPNSSVLRNKLNITEADMLNEAERAFTSLKIAELEQIILNGLSRVI